ncbi:MAG: cytidylate kinase-like family protein [Clostridia bacterium]|nr:cytidylate kinase-like family protein [Clostridia bacterium]
MKSGTIITLGRQCGCGGHEIGKKLAERLGIAFYDKELLQLAVKNSGIAPENFEAYDEVPTNSLLYYLSIGNYGTAGVQYETPIHQKVFLAQFETIQKLADEGQSCVILGRCADYALSQRNRVINVFLRADPRERAKRLMEKHDLTEKKAADLMVKTDKRRASYHNFYASTRWGSADSYDLIVDSLKTGIDNTVELIAAYTKMRFPE